MYYINEEKIMLRDELISILENCINTIKRVKDYNFEIFCVTDGKPASDYKHLEGEDKTVFEITLTYNGMGDEQYNQHGFELIEIIPNDFTDEIKLEKSKSILTELNKAANDFRAGRKYEPTYMERLRDIFKLSGILNDRFGDWY